MLEFTIYDIVIALSCLVIVSYVLSLISDKTRIPTVLMLLALGIVLRETAKYFGIFVEVPLDVVRFFGVLGLILILFEAGLDLNLSTSKLPLIKKALASSLLVLLLSIAGIGGLIHFILGQPWQASLVYAVPLSVISSTVVASSIGYLSEAKREFLTYESSLSDIFGILIFNILISEQVLSVTQLTGSVAAIIVALAVSLVVSIGLLFLLARVKSDIKAFLIFAVLLLLYAVGHKWHIPTLLAVLLFGLSINNWPRLPIPRRKRIASSDAVEQIAGTVESVTSESAFLIRTFFFVLFGYTINIYSLLDSKVILIGTAIVIMIFLVRFLYLRIFTEEGILPELFFAPRGLVTVVLFYSIPAGLTFDSFDDGILFYVIVISTLVMTIGSLWLTPKDSTREGEEQSRNGGLWRILGSRGNE